MRSEPVYLHENWLAKSNPTDSENVGIIHLIKDQGSFSFFNLLDNFNVGLTFASTFLLSFLGILAISFLLNELTRRIHCEDTAERRGSKLSMRIASALSSFGHETRLSAIGLFLLSTQLFLWFSELFLTNNIQVEV